MPAYRFLNPAPVFLNIPGTELIPFGFWHFYERGTTTEKDTWSDPELTILNSNPVELDSSGRMNTDVWLDGEYTAVLKDAQGVTITSKVITSGIPSGLAIPALAPGFLTNDLSNLIWQDIETQLLPDPTGSADYILSTDGANVFWIPQPTPPDVPDPEIVIDGTTFRAGISDSTTKFYIQTGSGSAPPSGSEDTNTSVNFPVVFDTIWHLSITQRHNGVTTLAAVPSQTVTAQSVAGFSVRFSTLENSEFAGWQITSPVPFDWMAVGTRIVA